MYLGFGIEVCPIPLGSCNPNFVSNDEFSGCIFLPNCEKLNILKEPLNPFLKNYYVCSI
jgi:hypothetical protein